MKINLLFFGSLSAIIGNNSLTIEHITDTASLHLMLFEQFPALATATFIVALNNEVIQSNTLIQPGDTLAFLPPFSGG